VPLVRVCAAGVGSVRSWRTWRRAFTTGFTLDMLKNGRFLRGSCGRNTILAMCTAARYLTHYKEADNADTAKSYAVGVVGQGQGWRPRFFRVALAGISLLACAGCASMPAGAASRYALSAGGVGAARPAPAASLISASRYVLGARRSAERHRPSPP
jgi:hypothetical protein